MLYPNSVLPKAISALALLAAACAAQSTTLTFDDLGLANGSETLLFSYGGFTWNNAGALNTTGFYGNPSGYPAGAVSGSGVGFSIMAETLSFSSATPFTFNSVWLTGAWNDGLSVSITGSLAGTSLYSQTVNPLATAPTLYTFDWANIDTVSIQSSGGIGHPGYTGGGFGGEHVALDDLTFNAAPVPEPASFAMLLAGLSVLTGVARRRQRTSPSST